MRTLGEYFHVKWYRKTKLGKTWENVSNKVIDDPGNHSTDVVEAKARMPLMIMFYSILKKSRQRV